MIDDIISELEVRDFLPRYEEYKKVIAEDKALPLGPSQTGGFGGGL